MPFDGLRVLSLESRRSNEIERLIRSQRGEPFVAPSMREVPLADNPQAFEFAEKLIYTKHPIEVIQLQEQYLIRQMQALVTQTHELSSVGLNTLGSINSSPHPSTKD